MQCDKCRNEAIFFQSCSGRHLCSRHLAMDVEARGKHAIRSHGWMRPGDHIAVVLSRDKKSAALARFMQNLVAGRRDIRLSTVPAGEGETDGCSPFAVSRIAGVPAIPRSERPAPDDHGPGAHDRPTKIALPVTLDDIAREVLVRFLFGNAESLVHPPRAEWGGIPVICPFIAVPLEELDLYGDSQGPGITLAASPSLQDPLSREVETIFRDYHCRHPATRFALLNLAEELSSGDAAGIAAATGRGIPEVPKISGTGSIHGS